MQAHANVDKDIIPTLPTEAFASLPDTYSLRLSPGGQYIAGLSRLDGAKSGTVVRLYNTDTWAVKSLVYSDNKKFKISWIDWANDDYLLVSAVFPETRYGVPTTETRLLKVDIKTGKLNTVIRKSAMLRMDHIPQFGDQIIDYLPEDKNHILLELDDKFATFPGVYKVNVKTGKKKKVRSPKEHITSWQTDRQHRVRIGVYFEDTDYKIITQDVGARKWRTLWKFKALSSDQVWPIGFAHDANILYVRAYHEDKLAIFTVDLTDPNLTKTLFYSDPENDVDGGLIYSHQANKVIGIRHSKSGDGYTFLDKNYLALQNGINSALKDTNNLIFNFSDSQRKYLIVSTSDINPGVYYFGDRDNKRLEPVAFKYGQLQPELMAEKKYISYKARDGQKIYAFLTLPKNRPNKNLPTIIFPHGGPISYSGSGFDYWTQFFANQGYAVLQMNFRGSSGYGYNFMAAGLKNWGLVMQDDVEDGARWAISEKIADPNKICIVGASYGGYAALMGAASSDLYRCAISFAGVTDLNLLLQQSKDYTSAKVAEKMIGKNRKQLKRTSPRRLANNIHIPVLLIHGTKDRSVRVNHSRKMNSVLKKNKKRVKYVELKNGDHYLSNNAHRLTTFKEMQVFLDRYLSGI